MRLVVWSATSPLIPQYQTLDGAGRNFGSLAMLAAIRRASSGVSSFAADRPAAIL